RVDDRGRHDHAREPFVVRGNDVPGRMCRGGAPDRVLVAALVVVPPVALLQVAHRELPVLLGAIEPLEKPLALLAFRQMQEELDDGGAVARQVTLEMPDVAGALLPDAARDQPGRNPLVVEELRVHAHDDQFLVVRAIEDADPPAFGKRADRAPQVVVVELLHRRLLERMDLAPFGVDAGHHVLDRAVLAGGVDRLEDQQQRPLILRVQPLLQRLERADPGGERLPRRRLVLALERPGVARIEILEPEARTVRHAVRADESMRPVDNALEIGIEVRHGVKAPYGDTNPIIAVPSASCTTVAQRTSASAVRLWSRAQATAAGTCQRHARNVQSRITSPRLTPSRSTVSSTAASPTDSVAIGCSRRELAIRQTPSISSATNSAAWQMPAPNPKSRRF